MDLRSHQSHGRRFLIAGAASSLLAAILLTIVSAAIGDGYTSFGLMLFFGCPFFLVAALTGGTAVAVLKARGYQHWILSGIIGAITGAVATAALSWILRANEISPPDQALTLEPYITAAVVGAICGVVFHLIALREQATAP